MNTEPHSLFIGRWQPFHAGYKRLIEAVLRQGKLVVVAIRDTEISKKNPYTTNKRWQMIQNALAEYGALVKIITIPDITEVCCGRDAGYAMRKIELGDATHAISGTKVRQGSFVSHPIVWLTGQSQSGKTSPGRLLREKFVSVLLDGDEMRSSISTDADYSFEGRQSHNLRVARLAVALAKQMPVFVSVIAPFAETRKKIDDIAHPFWVYVKRHLPRDPAKPYEPPHAPDCTVDNDAYPTDRNVALISAALHERFPGQF